jgi:hypothetical protein
MYIPSTKKDVIFTVLFCIMMATIVFLWRAKSSASDKLYWALADIQMANDKTDVANRDLKTEKVEHEYTKVLLSSEKSRHDFTKYLLETEKKKSTTLKADSEKTTTKKEVSSDDKNKHGIPQDVFDKIQASAKKEWPDDYSMQVWKIDKEVAAYKKLKTNE